MRGAKAGNFSGSTLRRKEVDVNSEFRMNGSYTIIMRPTTEVERVVLKAMAEVARKGQTVTMDGDDGEFFVSVVNER